MASPGKERTRTAPPQTPSSWWSAPRMRNYLLFDLTGLVYLVIGLLVLDLVWQLGAGPVAWQQRMLQLQHPLYIAFHLVCLVSVVFVAVRFFALFPKAQPRNLGAMKPPPAPLIQGALYGVWVVVTVLMCAILAGVIF
jgi:fumarate reductase subunit C